jgi:hypothetical protein
MDKLLRQSITPLIIFFVGFPLMVFLSFYSVEKLNSQYIDLRYNFSFDSVIVLEKVKFHFQRGVTYLTLDNGEKVRFKSSENKNYATSDLDEFIENGDRLIKHIDSDTLFIKRRAKEYYFVLDHTIYYGKK